MDAFFNEYTIRNYVFEILKKVVIKDQTLWIASERRIKVFGYQKQEKGKKRESNAYNSIPDFELRLQQNMEPTCLIEVKTIFNKDSMGDIKEKLNQNMI